MPDLLLPPAFEPVSVRADAFAAAVEAVNGEPEHGNFFSADASSLFDVAVVWAPEVPLARMWPARNVTMLAAAATLAALGPPNVTVSFAWPDAIAVNGALVGGIRTAVPLGIPPGDVPDWMVVGLTLRLGYSTEAVAAPGLMPDQTALIEEGFVDVTTTDLAESFARNLQYWIHRWTDLGVEPVVAEWLSHLGPGEKRKVSLDLSTGDLIGSWPDGGSDRQRLPAFGALPTWSLTG